LAWSSENLGSMYKIVLETLQYLPLDTNAMPIVSDTFANIILDSQKAYVP